MFINMFPSVRCTSEIALTALRSAVCIYSAVGSKQLNIGARKVSRNWGREEQAKRVPGHVGGVLHHDVRSAITEGFDHRPILRPVPARRPTVGENG